MRVRPVVGVNGNLDAIRREVVLVLSDVDASVGGGVSADDNTIVLVAGDGAEASLFVFDTTT